MDIYAMITTSNVAMMLFCMNILEHRFGINRNHAFEMKFYRRQLTFPANSRGWSGGAMVLGKLPVPGRPTIWITVEQGPTALVVGAGGGCLDVFTLIYPFLFSFSLSFGDGPI